jgi:hypothetical protein
MPLPGHNAAITIEIIVFHQKYNFMDIEQTIREKAKCCISGRPLIDCQHCNLVVVDFVPSWEFPVEKNLLIPGSPTRAMAIIHDDYVTAGRYHPSRDKIKFAVEFRKGEIIYHPVEDLQPVIYAAKN